MSRLDVARPLRVDPEIVMKLLLTSAGIKNPSIHATLLEMLGKPIAECHALCIPTSSYGHPMAGPAAAWRFISGNEPETPMVELGWQSMGVLELTALPSIDRAMWVPRVQQTDVLLVNGGDPMYLHYWMVQSGLAELLPSLDVVWVGLSAGSMIMTPRIGEAFVGWKSPDVGDDTTLGLVDFSIFPHLNNPDLTWNTMANAERWAATIPNPCYVIDDQTAIRVSDGTVEVISEGEWQYLAR